jgi:hypothetical protein
VETTLHVLPMEDHLLPNFGVLHHNSDTAQRHLLLILKHIYINYKRKIRVIAILPNTEQSFKGKGKTHKSTNRQNQSTTGKLGKIIQYAETTYIMLLARSREYSSADRLGCIFSMINNYNMYLYFYIVLW